MKKQLIPTLIFISITLVFCLSCNKNDSEDTPSYFGEYDIRLIREVDFAGLPTEIDTFYYTGTVRRFSEGDENLDMCDEILANSNTRITVIIDTMLTLIPAFDKDDKGLNIGCTYPSHCSCAGNIQGDSLFLYYSSGGSYIVDVYYHINGKKKN